jgi:flavin-dependent dehydrogenase
MLSTRTAATTVTRHLPAFVAYLRDLGLVNDTAHATPLGGWLKLGMIGTNPARGRVLLVGDAAGLVNPLQGEGIGPALGSGRAAAEAILADLPSAALHYRRFLRTTHAAYMSAAAPAHAALLARPRVISTLGRALTAPLVGNAIAGAWSLTWNDLLAGATPRPSAVIAGAVARLTNLATARSDTTRWFTRNLDTRGFTPT